MNRDIVAAAIQMNSKDDCATNVDRAESLVREAARQGAGLIVLPELFPVVRDFPTIVAAAEPDDGPIAKRFSAIAAELSVMLVAGTICESETSSDPEQSPDRVFNTSLFFNSEGALVGKYRKMHLFEVNIEGKAVIDEAQVFDAGNQLSVVATPAATIAQSICYDLRFPELYRAFADRNADIALVPSAFTKVTGVAHWKTLLQARAIENQMFVVAPNQVGRHSDSLESYGHSLIIDPWGDVLAEATDANGDDDSQEQIIVAQLSAATLKKVRERLPALKNRRDDESQWRDDLRDF